MDPIKQLQTLLKRYGLYRGDIDGIISSRTLKAYNDYRLLNNMVGFRANRGVIDGAVPTTLKWLDNANADRKILGDDAYSSEDKKVYNNWLKRYRKNNPNSNTVQYNNLNNDVNPLSDNNLIGFTLGRHRVVRIQNPVTKKYDDVIIDKYDSNFPRGESLGGDLGNIKGWSNGFIRSMLHNSLPTSNEGMPVLINVTSEFEPLKYYQGNEELLNLNKDRVMDLYKNSPYYYNHNSFTNRSLDGINKWAGNAKIIADYLGLGNYVGDPLTWGIKAIDNLKSYFRPDKKDFDNKLRKIDSTHNVKKNNYLKNKARYFVKNKIK